jgi:hypothetical protein
MSFPDALVCPRINHDMNPHSYSQTLNDADFVRQNETIDDTLSGKLRIIQKSQGYRYSLDAFL